MSNVELSILFLIGIICGEIAVKLMDDGTHSPFINIATHSLHTVTRTLYRGWDRFIAWEQQGNLRGLTAQRQQWLESLPDELRKQVDDQPLFIVQYLHERAQQKPQKDQIATVRQSLALLRHHWSRSTSSNRSILAIETLTTIQGTAVPLSTLPRDVQHVFNLISRELGVTFSVDQLTLFAAAYRHKPLYIEVDDRFSYASQGFYIPLRDGDLIYMPLNADWTLAENARLHLMIHLIAHLLLDHVPPATDATLVQTYVDFRNDHDLALLHLCPADHPTSDEYAAESLANLLVSCVEKEWRNSLSQFTLYKTL